MGRIDEDCRELNSWVRASIEVCFWLLVVLEIMVRKFVVRES